jgi:SAM-dependent methyltransferase
MNIIDNNFWNEYARLYSKFTPTFQKELLTYISNFSKGKVLDAGMGVGKIFPYLQNNSQVDEVFGFDNSKEMLDFARKNIEKNNLSKVKGLELMNVDDLAKFSNLRPDTLISLNVIYSISNPISFFTNAHSILSKGGIFMVSSQLREVNLEDIVNSMNEEFKCQREYSKFREMQNDMADKKKVSPSCYSLEEITSIFELTGFDILDAKDSHYLNSNFTVVGVKK